MAYSGLIVILKEVTNSHKGGKSRVAQSRNKYISYSRDTGAVNQAALNSDALGFERQVLTAQAKISSPRERHLFATAVTQRTRRAKRTS